MNSNKRDIYFDGRIYKDVPNHFHMEVEHLKADLTSYPVQGSHAFKDGEDVTGRYELERRGTTSKFFDKTFAIPTPAPVAELPKEAEGKDYELKAKELMEKFKPYAHQYWHEVHGWDKESQLYNAKQCALICCDEILNCKHGWNKETSSFVAYWQQVRTAINQI